MAKYAFEARLTNNENDILANIAGIYQASNVNAECPAGLLCVRGDNTPCEGFTGVENENAWYMTAAASTANYADTIYACNTYETKNVGGYFIGAATLGLSVPAGRYGNFTRINFDGQSIYRFGEDNIDGTLSTNQYFTIDAGKLKVAASAPTTDGALYFKLKGTGNFIEGTSNSYGYIDVIACKPVQAAAE